MRSFYCFVVGCAFAVLTTLGAVAQTSVSTHLSLVDPTTGYQLRLMVPALTGQQLLYFPSTGGTVATTTNTWIAGGQTGITASTNILGMTDANTNPLLIYTNNAEAMRIDQNGSVAIGTTPVASYLLSVDGSIRLTDATTSSVVANKELIMGQEGDTYGYSRLRLQHRTGSNGALFETDPGGPTLVDFGFKPGSGAQSNIRLEARSSTIRNSTNTAFGEFQFFFGTTTTPTYAFSSGTAATSFEVGNVGIGHRNPSEKFTVGGASQEFRVSSTGNLVRINNVPYSWPTGNAAANDYVLASTTGGTLTWVKPVTITVPSGRVQITGNGTATDFTISNSAITATSVIVISVEDDTDTNLYGFKIKSRAAGQFTLTLSAAIANGATKYINYMVTNP